MLLSNIQCLSLTVICDSFDRNLYVNFIYFINCTCKYEAIQVKITKMKNLYI